MSKIAQRILTRITILVVLALTFGVAIMQADVIQSTVVLPPVTGAYTLGTVCVSALSRCTDNATVSGFVIKSSTQDQGNEVVEVDANYSADIFTNNGGVPGMFLGHLLMTGTAVFTYVGRNPAVNPLGVFTTLLTDFDFSGTLNGNTFEIKQDPGQVSTGSTMILPVSLVPPVSYGVSGSLNIYALYSFNGGPFMNAPPRQAGLDAVVPEPGSALLVSSLLGFLGIALKRRTK